MTIQRGQGKIAVMFDDMISTAGSICGAAKLVHQAGAKEIQIAAIHGVLCGPAIENIRSAPVSSLAVANTIPLPSAEVLPNLVPLSVGRLLAEAIKRIHHDQSISEMFKSRV